MSGTPVGTLYRRALRRVYRRAAAARAGADPGYVLLMQACNLANQLAH